MAFQVSPGVSVTEIDLTTVIPAVSTTEAGLAGEFLWGPLNELVLVSSEDNLVSKFWKPNTAVAEDWFTAVNFLTYGDALWVVRVADEDLGGNTAYNATAEATTGANTAGNGFLVKNDDHYINNYNDGSLNVGQWIAKYPGAIGNSLKVSMCPSANAYESTLTGTVTVVAGTAAVTGSGTAFQNELQVGDLVTINTEERKVSAIGNNTSITLSTNHSGGASANGSINRRWEYYHKVSAAPGTSTYASNLGGVADELHVVVVDEDGQWTGVLDSVLEVYEKVSKASDAKLADGTVNYYVEVVNQNSNYIRWADHSSRVTNAGTAVSSGSTYGPTGVSSDTNGPETFSLAGGRAGGAATNSDFIRGYNKFKGVEDVDISLFLGSDANQVRALDIVNLMAEVRKDMVAVLSPEKADVVNNSGSEATAIKTFRETLPSSSYAVMDSGWKRQYDKYNDVFRWIPLNGDTAGMMVRTDLTRDAWWSPAGFNRGQVKNVVKLAYNPSTKADRDLLYKAGVNPVVSFSGQGTVLFGDKTMLSQPSAFDRINVRRLFIVLEKAISLAAKFSLFEFNDEFTRAQFRNMVEPFLRDVQGRRGITDFRVVADETNNTGEVIERNEFIGDIYVKPTRSISFIQLNFVAVRSGVEFREIVGKFG